MSENLLWRKELFEQYILFDDSIKDFLTFIDEKFVYANSITYQTMRGYTDVKFILIDKGAFFPPGQQEEVS